MHLTLGKLIKFFISLLGTRFLLYLTKLEMAETTLFDGQPPSPRSFFFARAVTEGTSRIIDVSRYPVDNKNYLLRTIQSQETQIDTGAYNDRFLVVSYT